MQSKSLRLQRTLHLPGVLRRGQTDITDSLTALTAQSLAKSAGPGAEAEDGPRPSSARSRRGSPFAAPAWSLARLRAPTE